MTVIDVALIITIVAFFKKQLGLTGWKVLLAAFLVALFIGLAPVVAAAFPVIAPWLTTTVNVVGLFLVASGSVDFVTTAIRNIPSE